MFVVLDSSIFCRDFLLRGKAFQILLESLKCVPARLCVPEVVIDEVVTKYSEILRERIQARMSAERRLRSLLPTVPPSEEFLLDENAANRSYATYLRSQLSGVGAKILPYPKEPHKQIVQHALLRKKPFNLKGQGYRDYLIWITLRSEMYSAPEETVVLVTGNTLDFCDGKVLAQSLVDELSRHHHPGMQVIVFPSLDEFNSAYVVPRLELQSKLRDALASNDGTTLDLHAWAVTNLPSLLRDEEYIGEATHGVHPDHARCWISAVDTVDDLRVNEVRMMSPEKRLVSATARVVAVVSVDVDWEQFRRYEESRQLVGGNSEAFSSVSWNESVTLTVHFSLVLIVGETEPRIAELDEVEGPAGVIGINELPRTEFG